METKRPFRHLLVMLQFKQDDTAAELILTLTEKVTIATPNYLFRFTHVLTKDVVAFVKLFADDESVFQSRYNTFTINPAVVFAGYQPGEWHYSVYEQVSASNTNYALSGTLLENGKMILDRAVEFEYSKYDSPTSYKTYNG